MLKIRLAVNKGELINNGREANEDVAKVNFMASDREVPVKPDVQGCKRETSASCLCSHKLADDEGTVIGMEASDLFQLV